MTEKPVSQQEAREDAMKDFTNSGVHSSAEASGRTLSKDEEQTWAVIAHLSSMVNLVGIPSPLGPLVVWLIKRNESAFVAEQAKASLNFALSVWIYGAAFLLLGILSFVTDVGIGLFMSFSLFAIFGLLLLLSLVYSIIGAVKASNGETYDYPFNIELVK